MEARKKEDVKKEEEMINKEERICKYFLQRRCKYRNRCKFSHKYRKQEMRNCRYFERSGKLKAPETFYRIEK